MNAQELSALFDKYSPGRIVIRPDFLGNPDEICISAGLNVFDK